MKVSWKQVTVYSMMFLLGLVYQPSWAYNNFWIKADFYDSFSLDFPYFTFLFIYASLSTSLLWICVQ